MNSEKIINCQNVWKLYGNNPEKFINSSEDKSLEKMKTVILYCLFSVNLFMCLIKKYIY